MESISHPLVGTTLGTCLLRQPLGAGGMGAVYLARQARPVRDVAVKVLQPAMATQQEFLIRFRREADLIAKLDHVNIMPIYEYGEQGGMAYLVMPYLTGGSLRDKLIQRGALSLGEVLMYIEQAASALDYAHAQRIIHRDIKPGNFLFHADGRLVLADFGIAHMMRDGGSTDMTLTGTGQFLGSPEYMAPEMVYGEPVDPRTDIYELGIVLFQMLSGRVPFQGNSAYTIATKHIQEPPPPLYQINPAISPAVDAVVRKAIAKQRDDRYRSAGELAQALRTAIITPSAVAIDVPASLSTLLASPPPGALPAGTTYHSGPQTGIGYSTAAHNNLAALPNTGESSVVSRQPLSALPRNMSPWLAWTVVVFVALLAIGGGSLLGVQLLKAFGQQPNVPPTAVPALTPKPTSLPSPTPTPLPTPTPSPTPVPTPSPTQQAERVVQRYYNAINQSDYQTAYQQWGAAYQNANPYDQFAKGFANTRHDDVVINSITPLSDGTVKVDFTLFATEQTSSGTTVKEFQGYYIVGQENGSWKLLTASVQQVG
jgi:serine/threonine protein kinase